MSFNVFLSAEMDSPKVLFVDNFVKTVRRLDRSPRIEQLLGMTL